MGVGRVQAFGVTGLDPYGFAMRRLMADTGIDTTALLTQATNWDTPVYIKPIASGREANRFDLGNFNSLDGAVRTELLSTLAAMMPHLDGLIVNQQLANGLHTTDMQDKLQRFMQIWNDALIVVDCRDNPDRYPQAIHKLNVHEARRISGHDGNAETLAGELIKRWRRPVVVTDGARGCVIADADRVTRVEGIPVSASVDPVGAGDSLLAGFTAALAAGKTPLEAATFGNLVAAITVRKRFEAGTASPDEIRAMCAKIGD